jgi:hypothetical protein
MNGTYCKECKKKKILAHILGLRFCLFCFKNTGNSIYITVVDILKIRDSFEIKIHSHGMKEWISQTIAGWFPSKRIDLSPDGVNKQRLIDRRKNFYKEKVVDYKTGRIIRNIEEKLSDHK